MKLQLDNGLFIDYEHFKNSHIVYINRSAFLSNLSIVFSYGTRDVSFNEGLLHLTEHYLNSVLQKILFKKGISVSAETGKEKLSFHFSFNSEKIDIREILDEILNIFDEASFYNDVFETEKIRVANEISDFKFKRDLQIEEKVDSLVWDGGLSNSIRGKNVHSYTHSHIKTIMKSLQRVKVLIMYVGSCDKYYFFEKINLFSERFCKDCSRDDMVVFDRINVFNQINQVLAPQNMKDKVYVSFGITGLNFKNNEDISKWICMSTLIAGHQNAILPNELSVNEKKVYSIYSIATKYRYENIMKIKCVCENDDLDYVLKKIKNCVYDISNNITEDNFECSKLILNSYIDETISSNLRLIEFVSRIFLMNGIDKLTFDERLLNSIKKVRDLDMQEVRDFANMFLKSMKEYVFVEFLNGGKI